MDVPPSSPPIIPHVEATGDFVNEKAVLAEILSHKLTPSILDRVVSEFKDFFHPYLEMKTCATCGERRYGVFCSELDISTISLIRLSPIEIVAYTALGSILLYAVYGLINELKILFTTTPIRNLLLMMELHVYVKTVIHLLRGRKYQPFLSTLLLRGTISVIFQDCL